MGEILPQARWRIPRFLLHESGHGLGLCSSDRRNLGLLLLLHFRFIWHFRVHDSYFELFQTPQVPGTQHSLQQLPVLLDQQSLRLPLALFAPLQARLRHCVRFVAVVLEGDPPLS